MLTDIGQNCKKSFIKRIRITVGINFIDESKNFFNQNITKQASQKILKTVCVQTVSNKLLSCETVPLMSLGSIYIFSSNV
jgi:hypothetical protein